MRPDEAAARIRKLKEAREKQDAAIKRARLAKQRAEKEIAKLAEIVLSDGQCKHCEHRFPPEKLRTKHVCKECAKKLMRASGKIRRERLKQDPERLAKWCEYRKRKSAEYRADPEKAERVNARRRERQQQQRLLMLADPARLQRQREYAREWAKRNREKQAEYRRRKVEKWKSENPEEWRRRQSAYNRARTKDAKKRELFNEMQRLRYQFDEEFREKYIDYAKKNRLKQPQKNLIRNARYNGDESYRERIKARNKARYHADPEYKQRVIERAKERRMLQKERAQAALGISLEANNQET